MVNLGVPEWEFRVHPKEATKEINPFDIIMSFTVNEKDNIVYLDEDLTQVIRTLAEKHGTVIIKVNWFSPDVQVIVPPEKTPLDKPEKV